MASGVSVSDLFGAAFHPASPTRFVVRIILPSFTPQLRGNFFDDNIDSFADVSGEEDLLPTQRSFLDVITLISGGWMG